MTAFPINVLLMVQFPATGRAFSTFATFATGAGRGGAVRFKATAVITTSGPGWTSGALTRTGVPGFAAATEGATVVGKGTVHVNVFACGSADTNVARTM